MQGIDLQLRRQRYGLSQSELGELIARMSPNTDGSARAPIKQKTINLWEHQDDLHGEIDDMLEHVMDSLGKVYARLVTHIIDEALNTVVDNMRVVTTYRSNESMHGTDAQLSGLPASLWNACAAEAADTLRSRGYTVAFAQY